MEGRRLGTRCGPVGLRPGCAGPRRKGAPGGPKPWASRCRSRVGRASGPGLTSRGLGGRGVQGPGPRRARSGTKATRGSAAGAVGPWAGRGTSERRQRGHGLPEAPGPGRKCFPGRPVCVETGPTGVPTCPGADLAARSEIPFPTGLTGVGAAPGARPAGWAGGRLRGWVAGGGRRRGPAALRPGGGRERRRGGLRRRSCGGAGAGPSPAAPGLGARPLGS